MAKGLHEGHHQHSTDRQVEREIQQSVQALVKLIAEEADKWLYGFAKEHLHRTTSDEDEDENFRSLFPESFSLPETIMNQVATLLTSVEALAPEARGETAKQIYRLILAEGPSVRRIGSYLREEFQDLLRVCDLDDADYFHRYCAEYAKLKGVTTEEAEADVQEKVAMYQMPDKLLVMLNRFADDSRCQALLEGKGQSMGLPEELEDFDWDAALAKEREGLRLPMPTMIRNSLQDTQGFLMGFLKDAHDEFSLLAYLKVVDGLQNYLTDTDRVQILMDNIIVSADEENRLLTLEFIDEILMALPERLEGQIPEDLHHKYLDSLEDDDWDDDLV